MNDLDLVKKCSSAFSVQQKSLEKRKSREKKSSLDSIRCENSIQAGKSHHSKPSVQSRKSHQNKNSIMSGTSHQSKNSIVGRNSSQSKSSTHNRNSIHRKNQGKNSTRRRNSIQERTSIQSKNSTEQINSLDDRNLIDKDHQSKKEKVNYQEKVISAFYVSMLDLVVDDWQPIKEEKLNDSWESSKNDSSKTFQNNQKNFRNVTDKELMVNNVISVEGSQVSLSKRRKKFACKKKSDGKRTSDGRRMSDGRRISEGRKVSDSRRMSNDRRTSDGRSSRRGSMDIDSAGNGSIKIHTSKQTGRRSTDKYAGIVSNVRRVFKESEGSNNRESMSIRSTSKESAIRGSVNRGCLNRDLLNKESDNEEEINIESLSTESGQRKSVNKEFINKESIKRESSLNKGSNKVSSNRPSISKGSPEKNKSELIPPPEYLNDKISERGRSGSKCFKENLPEVRRSRFSKMVMDQEQNELNRSQFSENPSLILEENTEMVLNEENLHSISEVVEGMISYSDSFSMPPDEETAKILFKSGAIYKGATLKKTMHGNGKFYWPDGSYYTGQFKNGEITGYGLLILPDLSYYFGDLCGGWFHGNGTMFVTRSSMIYSGQWKAGRKHGKGWLLYKQGNWYDGEWFEDQRQGSGLRQYDYGVRYKGNFLNGERNGQGIMLYENNDYYDGEWFNGLPHGYGDYAWSVTSNQLFCFPHVNTYRGSWLNGMREGAGIMNLGLTNGAVLAGIWHKNLKHGPGVMICGNGQVIEKNPLFMYDKPLHTDFDYSKIQNESNLQVQSEQFELQNRISLSQPPQTRPLQSQVSSLHSPQSTTAQSEDTLYPWSFPEPGSQQSHRRRSFRHKDLIKKSIQRITKQVGWMSSQTLDADKFFIQIQHMKNLDENEVVHMAYEDFPNPSVQCSPMEIPIHSTPESLDLSYFISLNSVRCKGYCDSEKFRCNSLLDISEPIQDIVFGPPKKDICNCKWDTPSEFLHYIQKCKFEDDFLFETEEAYNEFEKTKLRGTLLTNYSKILMLYDYYSKLAVPADQEVNRNMRLIRMFLWQMFRDIGLVDMGYSLVELDLVIANHPDSGVENKHCPFESIYLWQFIQILLSVSLHVCTYFKVVNTRKGIGSMALIFTRFLYDICLPNMGKRKENYPLGQASNAGKCLFEYRDLLPIGSVYNFYKSYGEPHTVRTFLKNTCVKKGKSVPCYFRSYPDETVVIVQNGVNTASFLNGVFYLTEDDPHFIYKDQPPPPDDPFYQTLYLFRTLGPKNIVQCISSVCPPIVREGVIVNMEYRLAFIEFYDIILALTYALVDKKKKLEVKMQNREEIKVLMSKGLWKVQSPMKTKAKLARGRKLVKDKSKEKRYKSPNEKSSESYKDKLSKSSKSTKGKHSVI